MITNACVNEIFSSSQGEGPYNGEKMTFVRFAICKFGCQWCDTDHNPNKICHVFEDNTDEIKFSEPNPLSIVKLNEILSEFDDDTIAVTGGEPLEQVEFLENFLPNLHQSKKILLETNGVHFEGLKRISTYIDIISMDIKLPSSTGQRPFWNEHKHFLDTSVASGKDLYVKLVITSSTTDRDINEAIKLISTTNRYIPVVLQPVTPNENFPEGISEERVLSFKRLFGAWLPNVSIIPQMHKIWGVK